ncbi:MAG TPA: hydroxymethylglutaryl-CoA lyase, partial [Acidimicrobiales bacterium]|nr:hydroxymethylglutaryl-CoA lyase [Acidimicrobiales bacterium]
MTGSGGGRHSLPGRIAIREVGPRDGLQPEAPVAVADRVELVNALVEAGVSTIEVAAFVSPRAVPAMAGAADVVGELPRRDGVRYVALVPNVKGAEMALAAGTEALSLTVSASEGYSQRNVHMSVDESL